MKQIAFFFFSASLLLVNCTPSTYITGSWRSPDTTTQYKTILVASLTGNTIARNIVESDMAATLGKSISVLKSIDELPPDIKGADSSKVAIMDKVKNKNIDGILTISLLSKETETRYVQDRDPYSPLRYSYYNNFWGYYSHWYPNFYNQGYYVQNKVYFIETNLYDVRTEKLVWSAQSKTYDPANLQSFSKEFAVIIVAKMKADKVIPGNP